jgi:hypothetical protein
MIRHQLAAGGTSELWSSAPTELATRWWFLIIDIALLTERFVSEVHKTFKPSS